MEEEITITITKTERDFIVDNALNGLWDECRRKQTNTNEIIELRNLVTCETECKRLMKKLNPTLF